MTNLEEIEHTLHNLASPKRGHTFWGLLGTLAVVFALVWLKHGDWLAAPNDFFLGKSPDGVKNYLGSAWHLRHDSTFVHFGGMNYPYGEHSLFADNQPVFIAALQWWNQNIGPIWQQAFGLINVFQIVSMLFGSLFVFLLCRKLHFPVWYAGLVTVGMTFLAPQFPRMEGHFGLAHTFVIPAMLYLLCLYEERQSRRYQSLLIGLLVWFSAQLHFYFFGMAALFLTFYMAFQTLSDFSRKNIARRAAHWFVMLVLPFAALNIWLHWADFASDRPSSPFGFTTYIGVWEGVFLPYEDWPLHRWISENITPIRPVEGEAKAYAGLVAFAFTVFSLVGGLVVFFREKIRGLFGKTVQLPKKEGNAEGPNPLIANDLPGPENLPAAKDRWKLFPEKWDAMAHHRVQKRFLKGIFAAAFALLLFACGFPFAIKGMEWMLDLMGPLRQFRGLGRFNWVYFYVANALAFYMVWHWTRFFAPGKFWWKKNAVALIPVAVLLGEACYFQKSRPLHLANNLTQPKFFAHDFKENWLETVDFSKYQALLPLPYYHIGSENIWYDLHYDLFFYTQLTAYHTGLPDMGVNMSRTSIGQTVKSVQLVKEPCETPAILADLPDDRPLALMIPPEKWKEVQQEYKHLIRKATPVFESKDIKIMELELDSLRSAIYQTHDEVGADIERRGQHQIGSWLSTNPARNFHYQSFDSLTNVRYAFRGKGAYSGRMCDSLLLFREKLPKNHHTLSFWMKANEQNGLNHEGEIVLKSLADGREISRQKIGTRNFVRAVVGEWAFFELWFEVKENDVEASVFLQKPGATDVFYLDEALLKPMDTEVFRRLDGWLVRNNFWYKN